MSRRFGLPDKIHDLFSRLAYVVADRPYRSSGAGLSYVPQSGTGIRCNDINQKRRIGVDIFVSLIQAMNLVLPISSI